MRSKYATRAHPVTFTSSRSRRWRRRICSGCAAHRFDAGLMDVGRRLGAVASREPGKVVLPEAVRLVRLRKGLRLLEPVGSESAVEIRGRREPGLAREGLVPGREPADLSVPGDASGPKGPHYVYAPDFTGSGYLATKLFRCCTHPIAGHAIDQVRIEAQDEVPIIRHVSENLAVCTSASKSDELYARKPERGPAIEARPQER